MTSVAIRNGVLMAALLLSGTAEAGVDANISWILDDKDCNGDPVLVSDYTQAEVFISDQPMVYPSGERCSEAPIPLPTGLKAPTQMDAASQSGSIELDGPGKWYLRMRVRTDSEWSNLSGELTLIVSKHGRIKAPRWLNASPMTVTQ